MPWPLRFGQSHPVSLLGFDGEGTGVGLTCFVLPGFGTERWNGQTWDVVCTVRQGTKKSNFFLVNRRCCDP